ncbi:MAG: hypothetical protein ABII19_03055 [Patescibacteria group bacterium]
MTKFIVAMVVFGSLGCGLWSGQAYGFPNYVQPGAYSAAMYPVDPLSGGYPVPPSDVCFLHRPPPWCDGPRCLPVTNETENHLRPWIDGVAIDLPETGGFLPPGKTCWLIADSVGRHEIQAKAYIGPPPLQHVANCAADFWIDAVGRGHHGVEIGVLECTTVPPTSVGP